MTGRFWLDWSIMAVSLADTIILLWLGLTVMLNAERRTWGTWLAAASLLLGSLFFISHTAILGYGWNLYGIGLNFWWRLGLAPVVVLPFAWYLMMLWYSGFWGARENRLARRHTPWLALAILLSITLIGLMLFENPLPTYSDYARQGLVDTASIGPVPLIILLYPAYVILCVSLAIDALGHPGPSERVMGELARQRARPWLTGTSVVLLLVSLLVSAVFIWVFQNRDDPGEIFQHATTIGLFDLAIESLIGIAITLLGQAVVAYEIFTGKALPRRGLLRHWRRAILLAVSYGVIISFSIYLELRPIYSLLLTALLMTGFYAMLSWRSYSERERYIKNLRPFVASQGIFDYLLDQTASSLPEVSLNTPFNALCKEVLDAHSAHLVALGPLAPLVGPPLNYPQKKAVEFSGLNELISSFSQTDPDSRFMPVDMPDANWAVPLWSERGLIGILLLGKKRDGGLYTQEEIEIAQTTSERLIDTKASVEIAQRLMSLQRQRLAESQLLDQRARRVLHDDVLQQLHAAMLKLVSEQSRPNGGTSEAIELLADVHAQVSNLLRDMPTTSLPEISKMGLIGALRKLVDEEMGNSFDSIEWKIDHEAERYAQRVSPLMGEVLYYAAREAIRNAARHGRSGQSPQPLHLTIRFRLLEDLTIHIEDDGIGVRTERIIAGGGGQGLALHSTMMAVIGGELSVESEPGEYTRVSLSLPHNI